MKANFYLSGDKVHDRVIESLFIGCPVEKELRNVQDYEVSDVAIVFGVFKNAVPFSKYRGRVIDEQKRLNQKVIILETGYVHRGNDEEHYYAAGFNGLNGRADFRNKDMPSDRWEKLNIEFKPWNMNDDGIILLCGQVPWDASVQNINMSDWLLDMMHLITQISDREVVFRPHPLAKMPPINGFEYSICPVKEDFKRAFSVITYNSNTAVESVIDGIPSFSFDVGSMAYEVTSHNLNYLNIPFIFDRQQWGNNLAYCQWSLEEMRQGETWNHLFR